MSTVFKPLKIRPEIYKLGDIKELRDRLKMSEGEINELVLKLLNRGILRYYELRWSYNISWKELIEDKKEREFLKCLIDLFG